MEKQGITLPIIFFANCSKIVTSNTTEQMEKYFPRIDKARALIRDVVISGYCTLTHIHPPEFAYDEQTMKILGVGNTGIIPREVAQARSITIKLYNEIKDHLIMEVECVYDNHILFIGMHAGPERAYMHGSGSSSSFVKTTKKETV